ncbi:MAG: hypothetical protein KDG44_04640, partial [Burkholderiaceae bacterium]|nr:hypothetical protein [Burkholderiaceae bacterium]
MNGIPLDAHDADLAHAAYREAMQESLPANWRPAGCLMLVLWLVLGIGLPTVFASLRPAPGVGALFTFVLPLLVGIGLVLFGSTPRATAAHRRIERAIAQLADERAPRGQRLVAAGRVAAFMFVSDGPTTVLAMPVESLETRLGAGGTTLLRAV